MKALSKKSFVVLFSLVTVLCVLLSATFIASSVKVNANDIGNPALVMEYGASVRVGVDKENGLKFGASMSNEDYGWFSENVGEGKDIASVKFGMFIAPANYLTDYADFTEENLFGENAKYDWPTYIDGEWVYSGNNGAEVEGQATPVRIINIVSNDMQTYVDDNDVEKMAIFGAIKNYKEHNLVKDFVGLGYYQLFDADGKVVETELATYAESNKANNTRSMFKVIQSAMENEEVDAENAKDTYFNQEFASKVTANMKSVELLSQTTVAGNAYDIEEKTTIAIDTSAVYTSESGEKTNFTIDYWTTSALSLDVKDGKIIGKEMTNGSIVTAKYLENITIDVKVYKTIANRADLDALGFDYREDGKVDKWVLGNIYKLANDIDYAEDTSTYGEFRMSDGDEVVDLWDRYLIPIAANRTGSSANTAFNGQQICQTEWGIFGKLSGETTGDYTFFNATIDGDGHAIQNAVIPYGVSFSYEPAQSGVNSNHGSNFIGALVYGGQLRNIAFTNLEFEDPAQVGKTLQATSTKKNPYYTDANKNLETSILKTKGYITNTNIKNGNFAHQYFNASNRTGLVGLMQNGIISNVYVQAKMKNGTFSTRAVNGLVVAFIDKDVQGAGSGGVSGKVENVIVETSYDSSVSWLGYLIDYTGTQTKWTTLHDYNSGMGAIVGTSFLEDASAINNCFAVANATVYTINESNPDINYCDSSVLNTIFAPGTERHSASKGGDLSTNCAVYTSVDALRNAQDLSNIGVASYLSK